MSALACHPDFSEPSELTWEKGRDTNENLESLSFRDWTKGSVLGLEFDTRSAGPLRLSPCHLMGPHGRNRVSFS